MAIRNLKMTKSDRKIPVGRVFILLAIATLLFNQGAIAQSTDAEMRHEMQIEIEADIRFLASDALEGRSTGQQGEIVAAEYIAARMRTLGLKPAGDSGTYFQSFTASMSNPHAMEFSDDEENGITGTNVLGMVDNGADQIIVIGAHYDHLGYGEFFGSLHAGEPEIHNGADDNASGVAVILQLAEYCSENFDHANFLIIGFSGEERGLWGSNYFTKNPTVDLSKVSYMLNYDMVGRLNEERKMSVNGVGTATEWLPALEKVHVDSISDRHNRKWGWCF